MKKILTCFLILSFSVIVSSCDDEESKPKMSLEETSEFILGYWGVKTVQTTSKTYTITCNDTEPIGQRLAYEFQDTELDYGYKRLITYSSCESIGDNTEKYKIVVEEGKYMLYSDTSNSKFEIITEKSSGAWLTLKLLVNTKKPDNVGSIWTLEKDYKL